MLHEAETIVTGAGQWSLEEQDTGRSFSFAGSVEVGLGFRAELEEFPTAERV